MKTPLQCMQECEQSMNEILTNHRDAIDYFLFDPTIDGKYNKAKAYLCFATAYHIASLELEKG
ncbi:MAG: hypothetical protein ACW972_03550 [Promethearchaeota archaeon]